MQIILKQLLLMVSLGGLTKFKQGQIFINNIPRGKKYKQTNPKIKWSVFCFIFNF